MKSHLVLLSLNLLVLFATFLFLSWRRRRTISLSSPSLCSLWFYRRMPYSLSVITFPSMEIALRFWSPMWSFTAVFRCVSFKARTRTACSVQQAIQVQTHKICTGARWCSCFPSLVLTSTGLWLLCLQDLLICRVQLSYMSSRTVLSTYLSFLK